VSSYSWVHIEFHRTWIPHNYIQYLVAFVHFFLIYLRHRQCFHMITCDKSCWYILVSLLCPNDIRIVRVKLKLDDRQRLVHLQYSRYQPSQIFRTTKPNDCKNLTFNAMSFFLLARLFLIAVSLWQKLCPLSVLPTRSQQTSHVIVVRISLSLSPYMKSNSDFFSAKIEQSFLIHSANYQIHNTPYDWKINDLYRSFRYLISW